MAYYKNNYKNRNNRYNGGYEMKNNYRYNENRPQEQTRPTGKRIDLTQFKNNKVEEVYDMNGKKYIVNLNFPDKLIRAMLSIRTKIMELNSIDSTDYEAIYDKTYGQLKDIVLVLINNNPDNQKYTWEDISDGFDNIFAMEYVVTELLNLSANKSEKPSNKR